MTLAQFIALIPSAAEAIKDLPDVIEAVENVFTALRQKRDPSPELMHLEILAVAHELKLNASNV